MPRLCTRPLVIGSCFLLSRWASSLEALFVHVRTSSCPTEVGTESVWGTLPKFHSPAKADKFRRNSAENLGEA